MFIPIEKDVYAWNVPDAEFGELMQGHICLQKDSYVLIDPPLMPDLLERSGAFGKCLGVIILSPSHKRGGIFASRMLGTSFYFPRFASSQPGAPSEMDNLIQYEAGHELPGDLHALEIKTDIGIFGDHRVHEMALVDRKSRIFIADVCHGTRFGKLALAPEDILPSYRDEQVKSSMNAILKAVPRGIVSGFFGHGKDITGDFSDLLKEREDELK